MAAETGPCLCSTQSETCFPISSGNFPAKCGAVSACALEADVERQGDALQHPVRRVLPGRQVRLEDQPRAIRPPSRLSGSRMLTSAHMSFACGISLVAPRRDHAFCSVFSACRGA